MTQNWVVLKFGGTSVVGLSNWKTIKSVLQRRIANGYRPLIVCSALSKVSNKLEALIRKVESGSSIEEDLLELCQVHQSFALELGLTAKDVIGDILHDLEQLFRGAALIQEVSPRLRARLLSSGELLSTRLGAAWLNQEGLSTLWLDARRVLTSISHGDPVRDFISATCRHDYDPHLVDTLSNFHESVVLTQGFIAIDQQGRTTLLGRGGSDTSASYFASKLGAERLEIWTDVPGLFTANPHAIPSARIIRRLDYDEAQEMASTGAKALHPRCIPPIKASGIPLHIACTNKPEIDGTVICRQKSASPGLKSISVRKGLALISMDTVGMWQQVGFLADVFVIFKNLGLSIDLVATSEANVTVSLDPSANSLDTDVIESLMQRLSEHCRPTFIGSVASVSLVGRKIRAILNQLGPVFEKFADHKVHLLSQAASDLNLTFVVDEAHADGLVPSLHAKLFALDVADPDIGPTWTELISENKPIISPWWLKCRDHLIEIAAEQSPVYVYSKEKLSTQANALKGLESVDRIFYAVKANPNEDIIQLFHSMGLGFECVSPQELDHVISIVGELPSDRLLFTPNFAHKEDYEYGFKVGATVTLDSIFPLKKWPSVFARQDVSLRLDPGKGQGHHKYVVTAGSNSKFGVPGADLKELIQLTKAQQVKIVGLHAHAGSGIVDSENWKEKAIFLSQVAHHFPHLKFLNLGGGFGVVERRGQRELDLERVELSLLEFKSAHPQWQIWIEPGRYLVAEAGVLLSKVTQIKNKGEKYYVGSDAGMNSLIRPALYGAWHEIYSLSRFDEKHTIIADIVGPICESGDVMGRDRSLPITESGDILLTDTAGAYGRSMSSLYNLRPPADELFID